MQFAQHLLYPMMPFPHAGIRRHPQATSVVERLEDGQFAMHDIVLGHVAKFSSKSIEVLVQTHAVDQDLPMRCGPESVHGIEQGGFARTGGADQSHERTRRDGQRDILQKVLLIVDTFVESKQVQAQAIVLVCRMKAVGRKAEFGRSHLNDVTGVDDFFLFNPTIVDKGAVVAAQITNSITHTYALDNGMVAGYAAITEMNVIVRRASNTNRILPFKLQ